MQGRFLLPIAIAAATISCAPPKTARNAQEPPRPRVAVKGIAKKVVEGARKQLENPAFYDNSYASLSYPNGDVPKDRGACTDVVIRSLRNAGKDLQKLIHEDMKTHFKQYPRREARPDKNIDHRRVPNIAHFLKGHAKTLRTDAKPRDWKPGDIVVWKFPDNRDHVGVVSDALSPEGVPLVIHNAGSVSEDDCLHTWTIVGHYRYPVR